MTPSFIRLGKLCGEASGDGVQLGLCLRDRNARLQKTDGAQKMGAAALHSRIFERRRKPKIGLGEDGHIVCEDSDDCASLAVESDRFPDDVWVAAEPLQPQMVAEDYDLGIGCFFVGQGKHASITRLNAKGVEEARRYHGAVDLNGLVGSGEVEERISHGPSAVVFKRLGLRAIVHKVGRRNGSLVTEGTIAPAPHQSGGIFELQRTEEHCVHHGE